MALQPYWALSCYITTFDEVVRSGRIHYKPVGAGTGFIYRCNEKYYLVTCRHVLCIEEVNYMPQKVKIILWASKRGKDEQKVFEAHAYTVSLNLWDGDESVWLQHKNAETPDYEFSKQIGAVLHVPDVAIVDLTEHLSSKGLKPAFAIENKHMVPEDVRFAPGTRLFVLGFPKGFFDPTRPLALSIPATLTSPYGVNFLGKPCFLVTAPGREGLSGSPLLYSDVFLQREEGVHLGTHFLLLLGVFSAGEQLQNRLYFGLGGCCIVWYPGVISEIISNGVRHKIQ